MAAEKQSQETPETKTPTKPTTQATKPKAPSGVRIAELFYWISSISRDLASRSQRRFRKAAALQVNRMAARLRSCATVQEAMAARDAVLKEAAVLAGDPHAASPRGSHRPNKKSCDAISRMLAAGRTPWSKVHEWVEAAMKSGVSFPGWRWSDTPGATLLDKLGEAAGEIEATCGPFDSVSFGPILVAGDVWARSHYSAIGGILREIIRMAEADDLDGLGAWLSTVNLRLLTTGIELEERRQALLPAMHKAGAIDGEVDQLAGRIASMLRGQARPPDADIDSIGHDLLTEAWNGGQGYKLKWGELAQGVQKRLAANGRELKVSTVETHLKQRAPSTKSMMSQIQAELEQRKHASIEVQKKKTLPKW